MLLSETYSNNPPKPSKEALVRMMKGLEKS
jgi:hypothetical protein